MTRTRPRETEFHCTPDYDNARGIAEALRAAIITTYHVMQDFRRQAVALPEGSHARSFEETCAANARAQLSTLLRIRRDGIG